MKRSIRYNTFETNSSSIHTLQISKEGLSPSELKIRKKDGMIRVPLKYWGKETAEYTSQLDKLSYICTRAWFANSSHRWDWEVDNDEENYVLRYIEKAICDYTGAIGLELYIPKGVKPGFDHQTIPEYSDDMAGMCNVYDEESVQNFVFNRFISFTTGMD